MIVKGYNDARSILFVLRELQGIPDARIRELDLKVEPLDGDPEAEPMYYHGTELLLFEKMEALKGLVLEPYYAPRAPISNS